MKHHDSFGVPWDTMISFMSGEINSWWYASPKLMRHVRWVPEICKPGHLVLREVICQEATWMFVFSEWGSPFDRWTERSCIVLHYTWPGMSFITLALTDPEGNHVTTLKNKEEIFRRSVFPHPPVDTFGLLPLQPSMKYRSVATNAVRRALYNQVQTKSSWPDLFNFKALRLLWEWDTR